MTMYFVVPFGTGKPQGFEDLWEAIDYQEELAMNGIKSEIERSQLYGDFYVA